METKRGSLLTEQDVTDAYAFVADLEARLIPKSSMNAEQIALWYGNEDRDGILKTAYTTIEAGEDRTAIMAMASKLRAIPLEERRTPDVSKRSFELGRLALIEDTALAA